MAAINHQTFKVLCIQIRHATNVLKVLRAGLDEMEDREQTLTAEQQETFRDLNQQLYEAMESFKCDH